MNAGKVIVVPQTTPDYRREFYEELAGRLDGRLRVLTARKSIHGQDTVVDGLGELIDVRPSTLLLGGRLLYQHLPRAELLDAEVVIVDLNPRVASTWRLLADRRRRGRPTILWGHAWPIRGPDAPTEALRSLLRRRADALLSYTTTQAHGLRERHPGLPVFVAPNAVYRRDRLPLPGAGGAGRAFTYLGRLIPAKKPALALAAYARARDALGVEARLVVVGDGPLREELRLLARTLGIADAVEFRGHVTDAHALEEILAETVATLSPGYAGLALTQSLYCGVPVIVARDEPHSPEIETLVEGTTGFFCRSDDVGDLAATLARCWQERETWAARRRELAVATRERYSVEAMADGFVRAIEHVSG